MTRTLLVAFQQAARSITLILLPIAFISLITWATAGSSTGNTADPIRAALWFFLIAHHIPLDLSLSNSALSGNLTYFPIGALLIPFLAVRSGYKRVIENLEVHTLRDKRTYVFSLAICYAAIGTILSSFAIGTTVNTQWYVVFSILFLVAAVCGFISSNLMPEHGLQFPWQRGLRVAWIVTLALIGVGGILFSISLIWHFATVLDLTRVIEPGFFGGLAFLAVQILYLPNFAVAALSYIAGSGVVIGQGSWLNPFVHRIEEIPAIPLLGGLPVHPYPFIAIAAFVILGAGAQTAKYGKSCYSDPTERKRFYYAAICFVMGFALLIGQASSGELLSANLNSFGAQWWLMPFFIGFEFSLGLGIYLFIPVLKEMIKESRNVNKESI